MPFGHIFVDGGHIIGPVDGMGNSVGPDDFETLLLLDTDETGVDAFD